MAESDRARFPGPAARDRFARTLHMWRLRAGWAHDTLDRWGESAGFTRVQNSVFSKLERGLTHQPLPLTFIQLGIANDRLARKDYGLITDQKLRHLVQAQTPITDDQGNPWSEVDFFGHFCGTIPAPAWADVPELMTPAEAERISLQQREIFNQYAQGLMLPPPVAFSQLESHCKGMSPEQVATFKKVLGGWHVWTPEEMGDLTDEAGKNAAVQAMLTWCDQDDLCRQFRNMCPD